LTAARRPRTIAGVRRALGRIWRGFLFGFSAAVGAWVAIVLISILLMLVLRPWG
jgi:hypothetical protein